MNTGRAYEVFAEMEAAGSSPIYERLALAVAGSPQLLGCLDALPVAKRQPNLLLASARLAAAPLNDEFVEFVLDRWAEVAEIMLTHATQTNEPARSAMLLPMLATVDEDVALIEVGCSAGLCLYPDRYRISYGGHPPLVAESAVEIDVMTAGRVPIPRRLPTVTARIGIDLHPHDVRVPADRTWLEALIWPEHDDRLARLRAAASVVAADPPELVTGDLLDDLDDVLELAPPGARPVVFHSAVLSYVDVGRRTQFVKKLRQRSEVLWISNEGPGVIAGHDTSLRPPAVASAVAHFVVGVDGAAVGISDPHGRWIRWPD